MGLSPLTFVGVSQFSADFQTILSRAVQIAELPIKALQNRDVDALQKKTLLGDLSSAISGLRTSLTTLGTTAENRALTASSTNTSVVTVQAGAATTAASYTINTVTSIATAASERTATSYADSAATPVASVGDLKLVVGSNQYTFTPATNTLVGVRDEINALGAGVTATILTTEGGNYLSISATATGATTLELYDDPTGANTNLLTATNQGTDAVFQLNGIDVQQSTNLVNSVIPGLSFTIKDVSASAVTLSLSSDRGKLSTALQNLVTNYNTVRGKVNGQVGAAAGLLSGNIIVQQLQTQLRGIASYRSADGSINSLTDLGIRFDQSGTATFDTAIFNALTDSQVSGAFTFVGTATTGLGEFAKSLSQYTDPISGLIKLEQDGLDRVDRTIQKQIEAINQRIDVMRKGILLRLQQADVLLAGLESQQNTLSASLQGLNVVLYGKKDN